ncbi:MAG: hypothetical protein AAF652_20720 [Cyanobacteria bacterium P01_C01_bin.72]
MKKLTPIELEDGTVIYMEVQEDIEIVSEATQTAEETGEVTRGDLGRGEKGRGRPTMFPQEQIRQIFTEIAQSTPNLKFF